MKKEFDTIDEAQDFIVPLAEEQKYIIDVRPAGARYTVQWEEHKTYVAFDGKVFHDEIWVTEDGRLLQVQDIDVDHCRNIIRMMLRNERKASARMEELTKQLIEELGETTEDLQDEVDNLPEADSGKMLH